MAIRSREDDVSLNEGASNRCLRRDDKKTIPPCMKARASEIISTNINSETCFKIISEVRQDHNSQNEGTSTQYKMCLRRTTSKIYSVSWEE
jgi:hypothetical protein